jgi:hypothetical protein
LLIYVDAGDPDVISVYENKSHKLHTTRSWSFVDMDNTRWEHTGVLWKKAKFGSDVIIATLDSGNITETNIVLSDKIES